MKYLVTRSRKMPFDIPKFLKIKQPMIKVSASGNWYMICFVILTRQFRYRYHKCARCSNPISGNIRSIAAFVAVAFLQKEIDTVGSEIRGRLCVTTQRLLIDILAGKQLGYVFVVLKQGKAYLITITSEQSHSIRQHSRSVDIT